MNYVLDTDIITALLKGNEIVKEKLDESFLLNKEIFINGINYYEIKRGLLDTNAKNKLSAFDKLCTECKVLLFDKLDIFDKASEIYVNLKKRGLRSDDDADILIASIAIIHNLILVTNNTKDFKKIPAIKLENWLAT